MVSLEDFCRIRFGRNFFSLPREYVQSHRITRVMQDTHTHTAYTYIYTHTHIYSNLSQRVYTQGRSPSRYVLFRTKGEEIKKRKRKNGALRNFQKKN